MNEGSGLRVFRDFWRRATAGRRREVPSVSARWQHKCGACLCKSQSGSVASDRGELPICPGGPTASSVRQGLLQLPTVSGLGVYGASQLVAPSYSTAAWPRSLARELRGYTQPHDALPQQVWAVFQLAREGASACSTACIRKLATADFHRPS